MSSPYRKERVASAIRDIVSTALARRLNDPRVAPLTTVTRVVVTGDLLVARVYLSVPGNESDETRTLAAIRHAGGYIQRMVAHELKLRQCPELRFQADEVIKGVRRTMALLDENRRKNPHLFESPAEANPTTKGGTAEAEDILAEDEIEVRDSDAENSEGADG